MCWTRSDLGSYLDWNGVACSNYYFVIHQASAMVVLSYGEMGLEAALLLGVAVPVMIALERHMPCVFCR